MQALQPQEFGELIISRPRAFLKSLKVGFAVHTRHPGLYVEREGEQLIYCHKGPRAEPQQIPFFPVLSQDGAGLL
jgi:hypothetical protein